MIDQLRVIKRMEQLMIEVAKALKMDPDERTVVYGTQGLDLIVQTINDSLAALKNG